SDREGVHDPARPVRPQQRLPDFGRSGITTTDDQPLTTRFTAFGPLPFLSGSTSKLMRCPSLSDLRPARSTAVMCTNTSRPPSSGLMKPYPRSLLKNLTVPVIAIGKLLSPILLRRRPP